MNKQKFKVGDRVRVVRGIAHHMNGKTGTIIPDKPGTICPELGRYVQFDEPTSDGRTFVWAYLEKLELINPQKHPVVVITSDGKTTTATMREGKKVLKTATAACSDKDTFSFDEGARIAFERLQGRCPFYEEKRPKRPEKLVCVSKPRINAFTVGKVYNPTWLSDDSFSVGLFTGRRIGDKFIVQFGIGDAEFIPLVED